VFAVKANIHSYIDIINFTFLISDTAESTKGLPILPILTLPSSLTAVWVLRGTEA